MSVYKFIPGDKVVYVGTTGRGLVFGDTYTVGSTNHHAMSLVEKGDETWFEQDWFVTVEQSEDARLKALQSIRDKN